MSRGNKDKNEIRIRAYLYENVHRQREIKKSLEYMSPGEVWLNTDEEEIIKTLGKKK